MGEAAVPRVKVPPALTVTDPPTIVRVLFTTVLNFSVPLIVVVLAVAVVMSTVTMSPARMVTVSTLAGHPTGLQVAGVPQVTSPLLVFAACAVGTAKARRAKSEERRAIVGK